MAGRLWIRVSAIWRGGLWVTGGGGYRGVVAVAPGRCAEGFAVSNGRIEATEVDIASKLPGVSTPFW